MFEKLKQIKDLRTQAKTMQSALAGESVTADHGGVSVTLNGNLEVTKLTIGDGMTKAQIEKAAQECFMRLRKPKSSSPKRCRKWAA